MRLRDLRIEQDCLPETLFRQSVLMQIRIGFAQIIIRRRFRRIHFCRGQEMGNRQFVLLPAQIGLTKVEMCQSISACSVQILIK